MISLKECQRRHVYRLVSRNLTFGVFDGLDGFIGIRCKFGNRYLFKEFHWEQGPPFGTVRPLEDLGLIPEELEVIEGRTEGGYFIGNQPLFDYLLQKEVP